MAIQFPKSLFTLHFVRLFSDFNIANGFSGFDAKTILINHITRRDIYIHSFSYSIGWTQPLFATQPVIGVALSKYDINTNLFTVTTDTEQDGIFHYDTHQGFPINETISLREPYIHLVPEDVLHLGLFVDNTTGGVFTKTVRMHLLLYYLI